MPTVRAHTGYQKGSRPVSGEEDAGIGGKRKQDTAWQLVPHQLLATGSSQRAAKKTG